MKYPSVEYYKDTDTLAIDLAPGPGVGAKEIEAGIIATFDKERRLIGIEILNSAVENYPGLVAAAHNVQRRASA